MGELKSQLFLGPYCQDVIDRFWLDHDYSLEIVPGEHDCISVDRAFSRATIELSNWTVAMGDYFIAGVIAHELGHIVTGDNLTEYSPRPFWHITPTGAACTLLFGFGVFFFSPEKISAGIALTLVLFVVFFNLRALAGCRRREIAADIAACSLAGKACVLNSLHDLSRNTRPLSRFDLLFHSHPNAQERIKTIEGLSQTGSYGFTVVEPHSVP